jgi:effector-binding domain-containing protein
VDTCSAGGLILGGVTQDVQVVVTGQRLTAVIARSTTWAEYPKLWRQLLDQVYGFLKTSDARQTGHNVMLYKDDLPNVEVGVEVDRTFAPAGQVVSSALPTGRAAMAVHRGSYHRLGETHRAVIDWCAANGHEPAGPRWEVYGDWREDEAELETEVYYLLT